MSRTSTKLAAMPEEKRLFSLHWLLRNLVNEGRTEIAKAILLDFDFLQAKLDATDPVALSVELGMLNDDPSLLLVQSAIQMSTHVLINDKKQLSGQILGRLLSYVPSDFSHSDSGIATLGSLLKGARQPMFPALLPHSPCLDSAGGPLLRIFSNIRAVYALDVTPDGRFVVSGSGDEDLKIWEFDTGEIVQSIPCSVSTLTVTPNGKQIVTGGDRTVRVWDMEYGQEIHTLVGHTGFVRSVFVTPDGKHILSGSDDHTIRIWNIIDGQKIRTLHGHTEAVNVVMTTPDGQFILSGSGNLSGSEFTVRVWQAESGKELMVLAGHSREVTALAVTPESRILISGDLDAYLKVWDLQTGKLIHTLYHGDGWVQAVTVTLDGKRVISGSGGGQIKIWDIASGECLHTLQGHNIEVNALAMTPDGKGFVSCGYDGMIKIWKLEIKQEVLDWAGHTEEIYAVVMSPDESIAISGDYRGSIKVWDNATGTERYTLSGHTSRIEGIIVTPDGSRAISASDDALIMWELQSGKTLQLVGECRRSQIMLASCGKYLISPGDEVKVWDVELGNPLGSPPSSWEIVAAASKEPILVGYIDKDLKVWDIEENRELATLVGHKDAIQKVAISADGRIVGATSGRVIILWNTATGETLKKLESEDKITSFAMTPDGKNVIAGSVGRVIQTWNLETHTQWRGILPQDGGDNTDTIRQFANSNYVIASAWGGSEISVWNLRTGERMAVFTTDGVFFVGGVAAGKSAIVAGDSIGRMYFLRFVVPD